MSKMNHNKDKITKQQERFINELINGESQRKAYIKAYPSKKHWKDSAIDSAASTLFKQEKIKRRYDELLDLFRKEEQEKTRWTREQSIEALRYVIDVNKKDLERIEAAAEEELELLRRMMIEDPERATSYINEILKKRKSRRASQVNNKGITDAVAELNKMQGFNEETINLNGMVVFSGEDELED